MTSEKFFVCGSLSQGMVHYNRIAQFIVAEKPATALGSVFRSEVGYPIFMAEGAHKIAGLYIEVEMLDIMFKILDELHGYSLKSPEKSLHLRKQIEADVEGEKVLVWAYSLNPDRMPKNIKLIEDGNWKQNLESAPPMTVDLTERQRCYIQKLGASSGRDIVPFNMELYRELMGKGLIVDKGRRLALTKLGQEVYKFIQ